METTEQDIFQLYDRYHFRLRKFIFTVVKDDWTADDLLQETFVRVQKNRHTLRDEEKIKSWIYRIAFNLCIEHLRRQKRSGMASDNDVELLPMAHGVSAALATEQHEMSACVQQQLHHLPDSLYTVIVLYDMLSFTHGEIARLLDITVSNTKVRLHRARRQLSTILTEKCRFEKDDRNVLVCIPKTDGCRPGGKEMAHGW